VLKTWLRSQQDRASKEIMFHASCTYQRHSKHNSNTYIYQQHINKFDILINKKKTLPIGLPSLYSIFVLLSGYMYIQMERLGGVVVSVVVHTRHVWKDYHPSIHLFGGWSCPPDHLTMRWNGRKTLSFIILKCISVIKTTYCQRT